MSISDERKEKIVAFMKEKAYKPLLLEELAAVMVVPKEEMDIFGEILSQLESEGRIFKTNKKRYGIPDRMNLMPGTYVGNERGFGFVVPERDGKEDVFIPEGFENSAFDGDFVMTRINRKVFDEKRAEGEIIRILKRKNRKIIGYFERNRHFGFVIPDNKRIPKDIFIDRKSFKGAVSGDKVELEITKWPEKRRNAEGRITEILGKNNDIKTEVYSLIKSYDLSSDYPSEPINEAMQINEIIDEIELKRRRDLRDSRIFTIDGADARDLDDAVSVFKMENGNYRLGVHIADVSHYVQENSYLDREAYKRATSVYLPDRVIPMLPEKLSNNICSLNPNTDKLTFSVEMEVDRTGTVINHEIFESIVNTKYRLTYTDVDAILNNDIKLTEYYSDIADDLMSMHELAQILKGKRKTRGAIEFNTDEISIIIGSNGYPERIEKRERNKAHSLIEEFMLLCNETVAEHFYWKNAPFVFRIHEKPEEDKVETLLGFAYNLGYTFKASGNMHPRNFQRLLAQVSGTPEEKIINNFMLRSMKKARYSHYNDGHFGLSSSYYSHFTSPIRRYPDLIIHRLIKEDLKGRMTEKRVDALMEKLPGIAKHCTDREIKAEQIERDADEMYACFYMQGHIGEIYNGIIKSITASSIYVEMENLIEGVIKLSSMEDDYYIFNPKQLCLVGERTRKTYKIGMKFKVRVAESDIRSRTIKLEIYDKKKDNKH